MEWIDLGKEPSSIASVVIALTAWVKSGGAMKGWQLAAFGFAAAVGLAFLGAWIETERSGAPILPAATLGVGVAAWLFAMGVHHVVKRTEKSGAQ